MRLSRIIDMRASSETSVTTAHGSQDTEDSADERVVRAGCGPRSTDLVDRSTKPSETECSGRGSGIDGTMRAHKGPP